MEEATEALQGALVHALRACVRASSPLFPTCTNVRASVQGQRAG